MGVGVVRAVGIVLVILGALVLGYQGFTRVADERVEARTKVVWIPPVVGGIVLVSGLILLVAESRDDSA